MAKMIVKRLRAVCTILAFTHSAVIVQGICSASRLSAHGL